MSAWMMAVVVCVAILLFIAVFTLGVWSARSIPIDMLLNCPNCSQPHIDAPDPFHGWSNPPHRSHECNHCTYTWRPADVATNGVAMIHTRGKNDGWGSRPHHYHPSN